MKFTRFKALTCAAAMLGATLLAGCALQSSKEVTLSREEVKNIVERSYQYVAMYNVNNKGAVDPEINPFGTGGWNKLSKNTILADHNLKVIARPNNDTLYQPAMLDLRDEPMILEIPAFDSKYVSLLTSGYDHYVGVPMSTSQGDYKEQETVLFFTERTNGYSAGDKIEGIDRYVELSGDFSIANHRIMPHANEPEKLKQIIAQIDGLQLLSLSEFQGKPAKAPSAITFPEVGATDADVFENNLIEVMQFVFNHTTFDPEDKLDQALLAAYKPLGVVPGKAWDPATAAKIDGKLFREVSEEVQANVYKLLMDPSAVTNYLQRIFLPKGKMSLDAQVFQSVVGPIGLPLSEAMYPPVSTTDGSQMNAQNDYVVRMTKEQLPPATAFWSLTLYDNQHGFFIPNEHGKYSVGENAGYELNAEGGIEIHVAAEKPAGVPMANWLPINRGDENIDIILRIYAPDLQKVLSWTAPRAELVK